MKNLPSVSGIRRAAATMIDLTVIILILYAISLVCLLLFKVSVGMDTLNTFKSSNEPNPGHQMVGVAITGCGLFVSWLYFVQMEASRFRGTLGKLVAGLQVVNFAGEQISGICATLRFVVSTLRAAFIFTVCIACIFISGMMDTRFSDSSFFVGIGVAFFLVIFLSGKRGQRIQDFFSRTMVVRRGCLHNQIGNCMKNPDASQSPKPDLSSTSPDQRVIVSCPKCSQQLRAPVGVVRVRCPSCRYEFST
jgi:uncharacterized RDD family membrane protein YckC